MVRVPFLILTFIKTETFTAHAVNPHSVVM